MRHRFGLLVMMAFACSHGSASTATPAGGGSKPGATEGQVCQYYDGREAPACAEGLSCCYPCGTDGCDSVCLATCPVGIP